LSLLGAFSLGVLLAFAPAAYAAGAFGGIAGKVTNAESDAAIPGIEVCAVTTNYELLGEEPSEWEHAEGCDQTGAGGEYNISGLNPESFIVEFFVPPPSKLNYITQFYNGKSGLSEATTVPVAAEKTTAGIDAGLSPGAEIAGTVTDAATGGPIGEAGACALRTNAKGSLELVSCGFSEADGVYAIQGLPSGSYKLGFFAAGFEVAYYNGKAAANEAELVSVMAPELTPGIDEALQPGPPTPSPGSTPTEPALGGKLPGGLPAGSSSSPSSNATLSLAGKHVAVSRAGDALVKVECVGHENCRAKLTLRIQMAVRVKGKKTLRTVTLGTSAVLSIAAGKTATAQIKLNSAGRRLLRDHGRLHVDLGLVTPGRKQDDSIVLVGR
jgi:hypothetical protein